MLGQSWTKRDCADRYEQREGRVDWKVYLRGRRVNRILGEEIQMYLGILLVLGFGNK